MRTPSFFALLFFGSIIVNTGFAANVLNPSTALYVEHKNSDLDNALHTLKGTDLNNALLIANHPIATWFSGGAPAQVESRVRTLVVAAAAKNQIPVLVAYNVPFRDCQQYSSGGAGNTVEYKAWIDGFAAGIGTHRAVVLVEPDGLGIIPHYTGFGRKEWCQPKQLDAANAASERFVQLNYAVDSLAKLANTAVYLDGTHSSWLEVGDIANRLMRAGVQRTNGFFLNASNYYPSPQLLRYGTWVSKCISHMSQFKTELEALHYGGPCGSYLPAGQVEDQQKIQEVNRWYDTVGSTQNNLKHFVIDTSRNGRGAWSPPANKYKDAEQWCNPPGRGIGERPTTKTSYPLLDAKLWIKVPGESDGECKRGTQGPLDPERGMVDPPAGKWFKEQATELIELAQPSMER